MPALTTPLAQVGAHMRYQNVRPFPVTFVLA